MVELAIWLVALYVVVVLTFGLVVAAGILLAGLCWRWRPRARRSRRACAPGGQT
jgi:hypothetical protein